MALSHDLEQRVDDLAGEYIARVQGGEDVDLATLAAELPSEEARTALRDLVADSRRLVALLPVQVRGGTRLSDRYRIGAELGTGGMGKVFAARDEQLGRDVAVKVLASFTSDRVDPRRQFELEARNQASFRHENVVTLHEFARDGDVDYIVMDLVDGTSVADVVAAVRDRPGRVRDGDMLREAIGRPVPDGSPDLIDASWWRSVARIVAQVARALEAAHAHDLVHRDIKPQNIMLRGGGSPVLLDFGLAGVGGAAESGDVTRGLFGSAAYLAPEQVESKSVGHDVRTDVYQLGAVLYEFLTLNRAFPGSNVSKILERIETGNLRTPRGLDARVPAPLEAICLRAIERDPTRRYQTAREFREDLERFLRDEVPRAARGGAAARALWRTRRLARRPGVLMSAAAVLVAAVAAWWAVTASAEPEPVAPLSVPARGVAFQALRFRPSSAIQDAISAGEESPVRVVVRAVEEAAGRVALGDDVDVLHEYDVLGAQVAAARRVTVYAASAYLHDGRAHVVPTPVERLGQPSRTDRSYGLDVEAGEVADIVCTVVTEPERETREGLWVFATSDDALRRRFDAWFARVAELGAAHDPDRRHLPRDVALRLLGDEPLAEIARREQLQLTAAVDPSLLGQARGEPLVALSDAARRSIDALVARAREESQRLDLALGESEVFSRAEVFVTVFDVR